MIVFIVITKIILHFGVGFQYLKILDNSKNREGRDYMENISFRNMIIKIQYITCKIYISILQVSYFCHSVLINFPIIKIDDFINLF